MYLENAALVKMVDTKVNGFFHIATGKRVTKTFSQRLVDERADLIRHIPPALLMAKKLKQLHSQRNPKVKKRGDFQKSIP